MLEYGGEHPAFGNEAGDRLGRDVERGFAYVGQGDQALSNTLITLAIDGMSVPWAMVGSNGQRSGDGRHVRTGQCRLIGSDLALTVAAIRSVRQSGPRFAA